MIVTVTPTIGDGTVVRWYHDADAPEDLHGIKPTASASRNGVIVSGYLHEVPEDVMAAARDTYETLRRNRDADVGHLATHRQRRMFGPYEPIADKPEVVG